MRAANGCHAQPRGAAASRVGGVPTFAELALKVRSILRLASELNRDLREQISAEGAACATECIAVAEDAAAVAADNQRRRLVRYVVYAEPQAGVAAERHRSCQIEIAVSRDARQRQPRSAGQKGVGRRLFRLGRADIRPAHAELQIAPRR